MRNKINTIRKLTKLSSGKNLTLNTLLACMIRKVIMGYHINRKHKITEDRRNKRLRNNINIYNNRNNNNNIMSIN